MENNIEEESKEEVWRKIRTRRNKEYKPYVFSEMLTCGH